MAAERTAGSTALVIAAWAVGIYVALKLLPSLLGSIRGAGSSGYSGSSTNFGAPLQFQPGYDVQNNPGLSPYWKGVSAAGGQLPLSQVANLQGLDADSAQEVAGLINEAGGYNYDGTPRTAGEIAELNAGDPYQQNIGSTWDTGLIPELPVPTFQTPDMDIAPAPIDSADIAAVDDGSDYSFDPSTGLVAYTGNTDPGGF